MKKILLAAFCLFFVLALPCLCFAEGQAPAPEENIVERVMNVVWYVILGVLFGGGLILISKWSKKINERDAELERQLLENEATEESENENEQATPAEDNEKEN